jgi:hypothetical protein
MSDSFELPLFALEPPGGFLSIDPPNRQDQDERSKSLK